MICTQVTQISHSTVGSSFSVSFSADTSELDLLNMMHKWFREWNMSGIGFAKIEPQNMASYIIEAYSRGYTDGADAVKAIKDEPQIVVDWKDEMWAEAREQLEKCLADKIEPTISKMEQVEDEPQRNMAEDIVESFGFKAESYRQAKAKTEPQAEIKGSKRLLKGSDEPQQKSCATCKHALGNWDGESNNCGRCCGADRRFYEPKDEPQTERNE